MPSKIKEVMDKHLGHIKVDGELSKNLMSWYHDLLTRNEDHVNFFGNVFLGVYPIRFTTSDFNYVWDILLEADMAEVQSDLISSRAVDKDHKVESDATNQGLMYLAHLIAINLKGREKMALITKILFILQFKFITSRAYNDWTYTASKERALATYNELSNQFQLKRYNNWAEYLTVRSQDIYLGGDDRKDFLDIITNYNDDKAITQVITGISTNIGKIINRWNTVFHNLRLQDKKIGLTTALMDTDEGKVLKDLDGLSKYNLYLRSNITKANAFINTDLVDVIVKVSRLRKQQFVDALKYISHHYGNDDKVTQLINSVLTHGVSRLYEERRNLTDINSAYRFLVNVFGSPRSTSITLIKIRTEGLKMLEKSKAFGPNVVGNQLTVICTYIVVWALLRK